jgi:multiple sugar transport system permease protein
MKLAVKGINKGDNKKIFSATSLSFYAMLLPFLVIFILFTIIPVFSGFVISLTDFNGLQLPSFVGLENYTRLFLKDEVFMIDIKNTLLLAVIIGPISYILSFLVAWLLNELSKNLRSLMTLILYAPVLGGNVYFIWKFIFSGDSKGFINSILLSTGILRAPVLWLSDSRYTMTVVIVVSIWMSFNVGFLSFIAGLKGLDRAYYEAAAIDGLKNRWQELYYVTFPQMGPQLIFGAVMAIAGAFSTGIINRELTGFPSTNYSTDTMVLHMQEYAGMRFELGYASAIAVVLFVLTLVSWTLIGKLLKSLNAA